GYIVNGGGIVCRFLCVFGRGMDKNTALLPDILNSTFNIQHSTFNIQNSKFKIEIALRPFVWIVLRQIMICLYTIQNSEFTIQNSQLYCPHGLFRWVFGNVDFVFRDME